MTELFLDSAALAGQRDLMGTGLFAGVTTNPLLVEKVGLTTDDFPTLVEIVRAHGLGRVFFQTWGADEAELNRHADWLLALGDEVGVKVPVSQPGLAVARRLVDGGVSVLATAVYHRKQLLLAAALGVDYVAPYVGRMTDAGRDGLAETVAMQRMLDSVGSETKLLVASLRGVREVTELAEAGVAAFTISPALASALISDTLTDAAVHDFEVAAQAASTEAR